MIGSSISGNLPRTQELIAKTRAYDRAKLSDEELEAAYLEATKRVIEGQAKAGLSHVNDGLLKWQDLLRPFSQGLGGVEVGPMARWFNNNTFYKVPLVKGPITYEGPVTEGLGYRKLLPKGATLKAVLPAPYTFAALATDCHYGDDTKLQTAYAEALNQEAKHLEKLGYGYIQLSDPALVYVTTKPTKKELKAYGKVLEVATSGLSAKTCLQTFFGDAGDILPEALAYPVSDLGFDLYETAPETLKGLKLKGGLSLGLIDARNSTIEDAGEITEAAKQILKTLKPKGVYVSTNCDADFLTWEKAEEKIGVLTRVAENLRRDA
jgi:5-methyltetrahydropteroyltriglutamate--homocysteine methyltransferase